MDDEAGKSGQATQLLSLLETFSELGADGKC
jgi:hypothetical protein